MAVRLPDTAEPMGNFAGMMAKHIECEDGERLQDKIDNGSLGGGGTGYTQLSQAEYDALSDDEKMNGKEYRTYDTGHIYKLGVEYGKDAYFTSLSQLGLTADATLDDVIATMPKGSSAILSVTEFTNAQTMFPYEEGNDYTFGRVYIVKGNDNGRTYAKWFRKDGAKEYIAKMDISTNAIVGWKPIFTNYYTSLAELGLTAPVSIGETFNAMPDKSQLMLNVNNAVNADATVTDAPHNQGVLVINKHNNGRFSIEFNYSLGGNGNTIRKWIGTLKGSDGTGLNWKEVAYLNDHAMKSYSSLADLELDETATINDIVGKMANNSMFVYKTDVFDLSQYENLQLATVAIIKQSANRVQAIMTDKDTGNLYIGRTDGTNKFVGWQEMATKDNLIVQTVSNSSSATDKVPSANIMARELFGNNISDTSMNILELGAGQWKVDSNAKASSLKNMPVAKAGRLTIVHLQGNDGLTPYTGTYKYAMYKYISINGDEYVRTLNSDGTIGNIVNDTGWQQIVTKSYVDNLIADLQAQINALK